MLRVFMAVLFVAAAAYAIAARNHWLPESTTDSVATSSIVNSAEYIVLQNIEINKALVAARKACGDMSAVITRLAEDIGDDDDVESEVDYSERIDKVIVDLLSTGVIRCLYKVRNDRTYGLYGPYEGELWTLLSTEGDVAVGLAGKAVTPWSKTMDVFRPDILLVKDSPLVINQDAVLAQR